MTDEPQRICPSCGKATAADATFCRECGAILTRGREEAQWSSPAPEGEPDSAGGSTPATPARRSGLVAALIVALLVAGIGLVYQRYRAGQATPVPGEPQERPAEPASAAASPSPPAAVAAMPTVTPAGREMAAPPRAAPPAEETPPARAERPPSAERPPRVEAPSAEDPSPRARSSGEAEPDGSAARSAERARRHTPGWYLVRHRSPLFREPSETAPVVTYLAPGTRVHVTSMVPGFLRVESATGKPPGYVSSDDVVPESVGSVYPRGRSRTGR
jgi:hypothetical protein